jgi:hypothetical protein
VPSQLASQASTKALICTTPRLTKTGMKFFSTVRTCVLPSASARRARLSSIKTVGSCTANCKALPTTEPQAAKAATRPHTSRSAVGVRRTGQPAHASAAISAMFQTTGAV